MKLYRMTFQKVTQMAHTTAPYHQFRQLCILTDLRPDAKLGLACLHLARTLTVMRGNEDF